MSNNKNPSKIKYYLLIIADEHPSLLSMMSAFDRAKELLKKNVWIFKRKHSINRGDVLLVYLSGKREYGGHVVADFIANSGIKYIEEYNGKISFVFKEFNPEYFIRIKKARLFKKPVKLETVKNRLQFIPNPNHLKWGVALMKSLKEIDKVDYNLLKGKR